MKKKTNVKQVVDEDKRIAKSVERSQATSATEQPLEPSLMVRSLVTTLGARSFASSDEAISFLVNEIASKLELEGEAREEMKQFLDLLIEADPELREEIGRSVTVS